MHYVLSIYLAPKRMCCSHYKLYILSSIIHIYSFYCIYLSKWISNPNPNVAIQTQLKEGFLQTRLGKSERVGERLPGNIGQYFRGFIKI